MKIKTYKKYCIKYDDIVKRMMLCCIVLSSLQVVTTPIAGLSIFQLFVILTGMMGFAVLVQKKRIKIGNYLLFSSLIFFSSILAFVLSTNKSWGKSYLLLGILQAMLTLLICNFFEFNDLNDLLRAIVQSQYITILMALYSFYKFYFGGGLPTRINLGAGFFIDLGNEFLQRSQAAGQLRLSLPFATPPVLSIVMVMVIIILVYNKELYQNRKRIILLCCFSAVLLLTGSRTGLVALVLVLGMSYILSLKGVSLKSMKKQYLLLGGMGIIAVALFLYRFAGSVYFTKLVNRFAIGNIMEDRHLLVPLDGIIIWLSSVRNFIFGIGFGSSSNMVGEHTYLPPYFLNSYVTYIVERGIMGVIIVFQILRLTGFIKHTKKEESQEFKSFYFSFLAALFSALFYETFNCYIIIFVFAIMFLCSQSFVSTKSVKNGEKDGKVINHNSSL